MNKYIKYILEYSGGHLICRNRKKFENELYKNEELRNDYYLFKEIKEYMKGRRDLEEVRNDPALNDLVPIVKNLITDYYQNPDNYIKNQKYIKDSLNIGGEDLKFLEEINQIKNEIKENNVYEQTENWVNEWNEKNENPITQNPNSEINKDFITRSLEPGNSRPNLKMSRKGKSHKKQNIILINGLAAAALIAGSIFFKILVPSDNLDKLFKAYYEPMELYSPVTRNVSSNSTVEYTEAIEMYKQGNYQVAAAGFFDVIQLDSSLVSPLFFEGITQIALGNYTQATVYLSAVINRSEEYTKEAQWYLGLSYLKSGDRIKAIDCFEVLAGSEGVYQDLAKTLLRRLK